MKRDVFPTQDYERAYPATNHRFRPRSLKTKNQTTSRPANQQANESTNQQINKSTQRQRLGCVDIQKQCRRMHKWKRLLASFVPNPPEKAPHHGLDLPRTAAVAGHSPGNTTQISALSTRFS